jgi:hypothetical protein
MVTGSKELLQFDFTARLATGETLTGTPVVTVTVSYGTDPSPSSLLNGSATLSSDGMSVLVPVAGGVVNVDYDIKVVSTTTNALKTPGMVGTLSVRY